MRQCARVGVERVGSILRVVGMCRASSGGLSSSLGVRGMSGSSSGGSYATDKTATHVPPVWPEPKLQMVESDDDLQGPWKSMELRAGRQSRRTGKTGRTGVRATDEDAWAAAGFYDAHKTSHGASTKDNGEEKGEK